MSAHTQGPWIADNNEGFGPWRIWSRMTPTGHAAQPGPMVAEVIGDSAEADANALLIAASLELLRALEQAEDALTVTLAPAGEWPQAIKSKQREALKNIKVAIAKATGSQP